MRLSVWKTLATTSAMSLCLAAAACTGGTPAASSSDGGSNKLTYLVEAPEDAAALKQLQQHIGDFEKQSGIQVDLKTLPWETMRTVLQTQLRSGDGPDVFSWGSGPSFGGALAKAGMVYDLTDAYRKYHWKVFPFAKQRVSVDGKAYGIPGELESIGIFYNKSIFDRLGIAPPQSIGDLLADAVKIRAAGITPLAVGDKEGWEGGHLLSMALSSMVGSKGMEALLNGTRSWNSPEVVEALKLWQSLEQDGDLSKSPTSVSYDDSTAQFYSGQAAMIPTGTWLVGEIDDNVHNFDVGYIPFPAPNGPGIFSAGLGSGPYISASSPNKDAALQFLNWLASPENGRWTIEHLHTIPPMPLDTNGLNVSPLFGQVLTDIRKATASGDFGYNIDVMTSDTFNKAMYDGVQAVFTGQQSPEEVAASLEAAAQK